MDYKRINKIRKQMKRILHAKRFEHTLGVAYTAANLASIYNEDIDKAFIAGLLHDCAKCYSAEKNLKLCKIYNIVLNDVELSHTALLHSKVGAYLAEHKYKITDSDILNAILYHTTGRCNMSTLEKIIYIADYIEPTRKASPNLEESRKLAFQDLDQAMAFITGNILEYLYSLNLEIDTRTKETYEYYIRVKEKK